MLAICVPVRNSVVTEFSYSLAQLTAHLAKNNIAFMLFFENGSILPDQRHRLVRAALNAGCNQILWLDSDMVFPSTIYDQLVQHQLPVVACSYSTRTAPYKSVAFVDANNLDHRLTHTIGIHPVYAIGMGCMLINASVFQQIPAPWFAFQYDYQTGSYCGEDIVLCKLLAEHGVTVYVDADASRQVYHVGSVKLGLSDVQC